MQCQNPVESEVLNVVLAADIVPDRMDDTQLLQALETLFGGGGASGTTVPVATILPFAGSVAPEGFMLCDGTELLASEYVDLFTVIGSTYGADQAAGSFKLPDLRGRTPVGVGQGGGLTDRMLGASGGAEQHQLTVDEMPSHNHSNALVGGDLQLYGMVNEPQYHNGGQFLQMPSDGGDQPHNNMQPFLVVNYIIKV